MAVTARHLSPELWPYLVKIGSLQGGNQLIPAQLNVGLEVLVEAEAVLLAIVQKYEVTQLIPEAPGHEVLCCVL